AGLCGFEPFTISSLRLCRRYLTGISSLGFESHAFGYRELHFIARRARALRPDRNEVIPLVEMLSDGSFKSTHDFLGQFVARLARAQSRAVIGYLREDVGGVALVRARQIHGQQDTAGSASQLRRRD